MDILILNLVAFKKAGGIEKVSRIAAKVGYDISCETNKSVMTLSMYDEISDDKYCPASSYSCFEGHKLRFLIRAIKEGIKAESLLLTHINLALPTLVIKLLNPKIKVHLIAHGIEVWKEMSRTQALLLKFCSRILAVSTFTKNKLEERWPYIANKIEVLNNCLDPYFIPSLKFNKPSHLVQKYNIIAGEKIILTVCRLSSTEKNKGYDTVIESLKLLPPGLNTRYFLLGKYDILEFERINSIIKKEGLEKVVTLVGFVNDDELAEYFALADLFIMPSIKEGFGIVFIEAAASGLPVIAGNQDGSVDALLNGTLGKLIDPRDKQSIAEAIKSTLSTKFDPIKQRDLALKHFNYTIYKNSLTSYLVKNPGSKN